MATKTKQPKKKGKKETKPSQGGVIGEHLVVSCKALRRNPWNYNELDEVGMEKLKETIKYDGFIPDIIVYEAPGLPKEKVRFEIIDGEHRWFAAKELGMKKVPVKNLGPISPIRAKALTIKLNELRGRPDTEKLALLVDEIVNTEEADFISTLPYDETEINDLQHMARKSLEDFDPALSSMSEDEETDTKKKKRGQDKYDVHTVLRLGHMTDNEEEEFIALLRELENYMGAEKKPYRLLVRLMRERLAAYQSESAIPEKKKKNKKKK